MTSKSPATESTPRKLGRVILGSAMVFAGVGHLTFARQDFQAQVPDFVPLDPDVTVLASGVVEIALGSSLILLKSRRAAIGLILAVFFVAVFPGNIAQWVNHRDAFGLDTDQARATRLIFQPVLIAWALWSTGAWAALRVRR
ncbi:MULTISPECIES: DoxX family protein [Mycobacteriales]|uniref:DoxX family membrane protein n=1 Tax=Gordonia rubripertincta TaxID=36822 RepID=A0ABT4MV17_GORRU|nr:MULTISPECIES: DoxX family membrane protein [Mycobacteriales]MCZ4550787.1 DoxX family membrane protein [Gordonia rubripertincta]